MKASPPSEIEGGPVAVSAAPFEALTEVKRGVGILLSDSVNRRLVEAASIHLGLVPIVLHAESLEPDALVSLEMIVADEPLAVKLRSLLASRESRGDGINPAVIAVPLGETGGAPASTSTDQALDQRLDGVLPLPQLPALVAAQMSVILYSHRAFARRYANALEELHLNRRIFRSVTSGICVADATRPDMPIAYVNPAFEVMTGYSMEDVQGRNCRFLQRAEQDQPGLTLLREALSAEREVTVVLKNFRKDGSPFWNELSLSPIRSRDGALTHFVGIQTDVTSRVEFEAALRESEKLAAVGRLASSIAHEINNPLSSVMNLLYLAQNSIDIAEIHGYLATADKEMQRVKHIAAQSLRFYKQSTNPHAIGCTELLDSVVDVYQSRFQNSQVLVERRERSTHSIVCMESEIRQVLNNLVSNAIDAIGADGGRLFLRTREATEWRSGMRGVTMTIADTGAGIGAETLKSIYKAFYTTKGIGGTGLGLWISSEIVERHHGRLMVRSSQTPGRSGTVFELFLPYQPISA